MRDTLAEKWARAYGNGLRDALADAMRRARVPRWRAADVAPETVADLLASYRATGEIVVSAANSERTIWREPAGNFAFRAWHDFCHVRSLRGFTAGEEIELGEWQCGAFGGVGDAFALIVREEISEQARYFAERGEFLNGDQIGFALETVARLAERSRPYSVRAEVA